MRWLLGLLAAVLVAAVAVVITVVPESTQPVAERSPSAAPAITGFTDPCGSFDTRQRVGYAVTGYWITPSANPCTWRHQLEEIHRVGGDTVIRLGYGLQYRGVSGGRVLKDGRLDPLFTACVEEGRPCVQAAEASLTGLSPGSRVSRVYTYRTDEHFGTGLLRCPRMDRMVEAGKRTYYLLLTPADGADTGSCDVSAPREYDLILVAASARDSLTELLALGERFGVQVFPALPLAPRDPQRPTQADPEHLGVLTALTRRILRDYGTRFREQDALGGVYQPFEVQLTEALRSNPTLEIFREQHEVVQQELPDKQVLISPYLDARRRVAHGQRPGQVAEGFRALAATGVGVIAPQDGRGTGKGALYWPDEAEREVDARLRPVVGESAYGVAYHGSTREYFRAMAEVRDELVERGDDVELWANIEAFEPSGESACAAQGSRGRTDKARLDQAVTMTGRYVQKVVSYMWSDFMTCGSPSLEDDLLADAGRPIAVDAIRQPGESGDGVRVRAYRLERGGLIRVSWSGGEAVLPVTEAAEALENLPQGLMTAWAPFDWSRVPPGEWVRIGVATASGRETTEPLHVRIQ